MSIQSISPATLGLGPRLSDTAQSAPPVPESQAGRLDGTSAVSLQRPPQLSGTPSDPSQVQQALDEVRKALAPVAQNLLFSLDDDTGRTVIKIIDSSTDEVIKQIPSEEILAISKALDKLQGLLVKQQA
ncbi:flagellar protein FlaG [Aromatoleum petrolei]|uniref:Flagellar protein n=1 Tax=Aromatoleum petrolei TaxID=76116 RepID=A0ABX1MZ49_9RHOO|nr:flagellar protein FlaG [Aromatoleum petrolei]NMF91334.1 flagellar protein [Aromatoleum petrolei]QTQ38120.1 FlaG family protein [Aromatoleum petrolei]